VAAGQAPLLQILLVIFLGGIELYGGHNLGHDRLGVAMRLIERFLRGLGLRRLFRGMEEDGGTILCAPVRTLTVQLGGIVVLPEDFERSAYFTVAGSNSTSTASACPVRSVQTSL